MMSSDFIHFRGKDNRAAGEGGKLSVPDAVAPSFSEFHARCNHGALCADEKSFTTVPGRNFIMEYVRPSNIVNGVFTAGFSLYSLFPPFRGRRYFKGRLAASSQEFL